MSKNKTTYIGLYDDKGNEVESTIRSICPIEEFKIDKCGRVSNKTEIYAKTSDKDFMAGGYFIKMSDQILSTFWSKPIKIVKDQNIIFEIGSIMILEEDADIFKRWMYYYENFGNCATN